MKKINQVVTSLLGTSTEFNRRQFLGNAGKGILGATIFGEIVSGTMNAQQIPASGKPARGLTDTIPVQLKPISASSEKQEGPVPAPLEPGKRIRYALVGLGNLTLRELLPAFGECKYSTPVALVSGDAQKAAKVAAQYGISSKNIYSYQNYDEIKNNPEIDAVYVVLPNSMHEEYTVRAAGAGKHVLCEKPMATSSKEAQRMIDACKKAGKKLMIAYRIQYEPRNRQIMQWVRNKQYGNIKLIEAVNTQNQGDPNQWRLKKALSGGGAMPDIGIYCLNTSRFLLGEEPESVLATTFSTPGDPRFKEVEESVLFQLRFPGGALVNCSTSYGVHNSKRYRAYGDNGGWLGMDPAFDYNGLQMEVSKVDGKVEHREHPELPEKNQFALEIDHMSQCIMNNKQPYTPGEEGLQDHRIIEAVYESAREGKAVKMEKVPGMDVFRGTPPKSDS